MTNRQCRLVDKNINAFSIFEQNCQNVIEQKGYNNPEIMKERKGLDDVIVNKTRLDVDELAEILKEDREIVANKVEELGMDIDENHTIRVKLAQLLAYEYGIRLFEKQPDLKKKYPIVSIMGHVDHGKTTLLDRMRQSRIQEKEVGGITQKIGAFSIEYDQDRITFIDTPGHQAFDNMRVRGGLASDIIILVVSATDGVQQQTKEVIQIAQKYGNSLIVAINKIDVIGSMKIEQLEQSLIEAGLDLESNGGNIPVVYISAKYGRNIDLLLELVAFESELRELKGNYEMAAEGMVLESRNIKERLEDEGLEQGKTCTLLIQRGKLNKDDWVVIGDQAIKIKKMTNDYNQSVEQGMLSTAVEIQGLQELPECGTIFYAVENERTAKLLVQRYKQQAQNQKYKGFKGLDFKASRLKFANRRDRRMFMSGNKLYQQKKYKQVTDIYQDKIIDLEKKVQDQIANIDKLREQQNHSKLEEAKAKYDHLMEQYDELMEQYENHQKNMTEQVDEMLGGSKQEEKEANMLKFYIKTADKGTLETFQDQIVKIAENNDDIQISIVGSEIGDITATDVKNALIYNAYLLGMNVDFQRDAQNMAENSESLGFNTSKVIYKLLDDVENIISDFRHDGNIEIVEKGQAQIKQIYNVKTKLGYQNIAGCHVFKGQLNKRYKVKLIRDKEVIYEDLSISQLKHFKEDVQLINKGNECGVALSDHNIDIMEGDVIYCYEKRPYSPRFKSQQF